MALFPGLPRWTGTRKVKPIWILLKQETVSGSGISSRISIQTAGLAFGGTVLCSYRVRGFDGSCAEHLTVESYTVFICQQSYLLLFGILSPTHSFIPGLKLFFFCKSFPLQPFLSSILNIHYMDSPDCLLFTVIFEHICSLLLVFLFLHFLVVGSMALQCFDAVGWAAGRASGL